MKPRPIAQPLPGEHLAAMYPADAADAAAVWHRRLNLFTGRTLTANALAIEQTGRAGRFAVRGQSLSPGIVRGLEVDLERSVEREPAPPDVPGVDGKVDVTRWFLHLAPGHGIAAIGEDVVVHRATRINLADVNVWAPAALAFNGAAPPASEEEVAPAGEPARARILWDRLGTMLQLGARLPAAGVLVLQPVTVESIGELQEADDCAEGGTSSTCDADASSYAYEDWQLVDGCRLVLYAWPSEWLALPEPDARWRNRLAWEIFDRERGRGADAPMPWERVGVPIGLVAFDTAVDPARAVLWDRGELSWTPLFVDRHAVARDGGRARRRAASPAADPNPFLWHARIRQFAEEVASIDHAATPIEELGARFRHLPPVGVLPRTAVDARGGQNRFFPATWAVEAAPVPVEQLEVIVRESAGLAPYDLFTADEVRVYFPVPQVVYEPGLLRVETVAPEFQATIDEFTVRRGKWLARRDDVRIKASALERAITGAARAFATPDPEALEEETPAPDPLDPADPLLREPEQEHGTETDADTGERTATALRELRESLASRNLLRATSRAPLAALPAGFPGFPATLEDRLSHTGGQLVLAGRITDVERDALVALAPNDAEYVAAVRTLRRLSDQEELSQLDALGVRGFIELLERKVAAADDRVDFGFARVQTDIYRVRQLMLGTAAASRLATSPALAEIAQGDSARATQETLSDFLKRIKLDDGGAGPAGAPAGPQDGGTGGGVARTGALAASGAVARTAGAALSSFAVAAAPSAATGFATMSASAELQRGGGAAPLAAAIAADVIGAEAGISVRNLPGATARPTKQDVAQQSPIVGKSFDFRTVSVAERLKAPPAGESKTFSVASKYTVLTELADAGINVDDLEVPGFYQYTGDSTTPDTEERVDPRDPTRTIAVPIERRRTLADVRGKLGSEILFDRHDLDPADADEASFFAAGIRALDHTVVALRLVEGRIAAYRNVLEQCRATLARLEKELAGADARLHAIAGELAEARHDVSVAKALLAEEQVRIDAINARRDRVIAEHVHFLVYQRTRLSDLILDAPARGLDPGLGEPPVPACLAREAAAPPELERLIELLRDAPIRWFTHVHPLMQRLDRRDVLIGAIDVAKRRALLDVPLRASQPALAQDGTRVGAAIAGLVAARRAAMVPIRMQTAQLDTAVLGLASWARAKEEATAVVSLGDLIDGAHGRADVARDAARELDQIARVAACLYEGFGEVLPAIRLDWAERLSQFDAPANLRNLSSLPRWGDIDFLERRTLQGLADWLFGRVDARQGDAVATINDIVRLALLLASHAPVDRIIAGHVQRDTPLRRDGRIELKVDVTRVRIGMLVQMYAGASVVAQGVVEDLGAEVAAARVVSAAGGVAHIAAGARAQFLPRERAAKLGGSFTALARKR